MRSRGFTLLEVLLSVAIFLLIAGAIFTTVGVGVRSTAQLGRHRLEAERLDTLLTFFREAFANLPSHAELAVRTRDLGGGFPTSELLIRQAAGLFSLFDQRGAGTVIRVQSEGKSGVLALKKFRNDLSEAERDQAIGERAGWTPLLGEVREIRWRFQDPLFNDLMEKWDFGQGRPRLVEMTLWLTGERPIVARFWIPEVQRAAGPGKGVSS